MTSVKNRLLEIVDDLLDVVGLVRIAHYDALTKAFIIHVHRKEETTDVCDTSEDDDDLFI